MSATSLSVFFLIKRTREHVYYWLIMQSQLGPLMRSLRGTSLFKTAGSCVRSKQTNLKLAVKSKNVYFNIDTSVTHRGTLYNDQKNRQLFSERNTTKYNNFMNITARSSHLNNSKQIKITHKSLQIGDLIFRQYSTQNTEVKHIFAVKDQASISSLNTNILLI